MSRTGSEECEERVTVQVWVPGRISEQVPESCGAGSRSALPPQSSPYAFGLGALVPFGRIFVPFISSGVLLFTIALVPL